MINSRTKGAAGEREFASLIYDHLGVKLIRNLEQSRGGGHDLIVHPDCEGEAARSLDRFAIECKRYQNVTYADLRRFWKQTVGQAEQINKIPLLAYRVNRQPWKIIIPLPVLNHELCSDAGLEWTGVLSIHGFSLVVRELEPVQK